MNLVNLTPHDIHVMENEVVVTYPASGQQARVSVTQEKLTEINGAPVYRPVYGEVTGLPEPQNDTMYIVSMLVRSAAPNRTDLMSPDSGATAVRENGQIKYVVGWLAN